MARKKKTTVVKKNVNPEVRPPISEDMQKAIEDLRSLLLRIGFSEEPRTDKYFEWWAFITPSTYMSLCIDLETNETFIPLTNIDADGKYVDCIFLQAFNPKAIFDEGWRKYVVTYLFRVKELFDFIYLSDEEFDKEVDYVINIIKHQPYKN